MEHPGLFQLEVTYRRAVQRAQLRALEALQQDPHLNLEETLRTHLEFELSLLGTEIPALLQGCGLTTRIIQSQLGPQCRVTSPSMSFESGLFSAVGSVHEMKSGDSLWKIARKQGVTLDQLYDWNPELKELDERKIPIGTRVKIKQDTPTQESPQSRPYTADIIIQCDPDSLTDLARNLGQYGDPPYSMPPPVFTHPEFGPEEFTDEGPFIGPAEPGPFSFGPDDENTHFDWQNVGTVLDYSMWGVNTSVGGMSTYLVYGGKYYKWNELWHQTKGRGTAWRWQTKRWNNPGARHWRNQQVNSVKGARKWAGRLTKAGGVLIVADVALSGELKPSHAINAAMLGASTTGVGAIVAGIWFIADFGTMGVNYLVNGEGKGLGDMIDEHIGTLEMYEGAY